MSCTNNGGRERLEEKVRSSVLVRHQPQIPNNFSMTEIGFIHGEKISHEYTRQREDVLSMRDNYLNWILYCSNAQYRIHYQDETWVFKNTSCNKIWKDFISSSTEDLCKVPAGKGACSIVFHLGCAETGLLNDCLLLFRRSKSNKSSDYHTEMNWNVLSSWCESKVFSEMMKTN